MNWNETQPEHDEYRKRLARSLAIVEAAKKTLPHATPEERKVLENLIERGELTASLAGAELDLPIQEDEARTQNRFVEASILIATIKEFDRRREEKRKGRGKENL